MNRRRRGNGDGSIFQRNDGRWVGVITVSKPGQARKRKYAYGDTRAMAAQRMKELERDIASGVVPTSDRQSLAQYLERWLTNVPNLRERTHRRYAQLMRYHVIPDPIGGLPLAKVSPMDVRELLKRLRVIEKRGGGTLAAATIVQTRAVLRRALSDALRDGLVVRNAAAGASVEAPRIDRKEVAPMMPAEAERIVAAVKDDPLGPLFRLALTTGMRQGEILGLRWSDVDFDGRRISIRQTYGLVGREGKFETPKTKKSRRELPMTEAAFAPLKQQKAAQEWQRSRIVGEASWPDLGPNGPLVFTTEAGYPLDPGRVTKHLHELLTAAGLQQIRFHDLRHGYATLLARQGVPIHVISRLLGHSTPVTTWNVYAHVADDSLAEAAGRLDALLSTAAAG